MNRALLLTALVAQAASAEESFVGFTLDSTAAVTLEVTRTEEATETMLDLMERELGISRPEACALASVTVDLHVTQVVNEVKGVHAILRT